MFVCKVFLTGKMKSSIFTRIKHSTAEKCQHKTLKKPKHYITGASVNRRVFFSWGKKIKTFWYDSVLFGDSFCSVKGVSFVSQYNAMKFISTTSLSWTTVLIKHSKTVLPNVVLLKEGCFIGLDWVLLGGPDEVITVAYISAECSDGFTLGEVTCGFLRSWTEARSGLLCCRHLGRAWLCPVFAPDYGDHCWRQTQVGLRGPAVSAVV